MAGAADGASQLEAWAAERRARVRAERPELLLISTSDTAMPKGVSPAWLFLEQYPIVDDGEYLPLSGDVESWVDARGWTLLRRKDVAATTTYRR
jgi:hypothetical protein